MDEILKECPFCGHNECGSIFDARIREYYVECPNCGACGEHTSGTHERAKELWNTRTPQSPKPTEQLVRLDEKEVEEHIAKCLNEDCMFRIPKLAESICSKFGIPQATPEETDRTGLRTGICPYCGGDVSIRNPTGNCDHVDYPDNVNKSLKLATPDKAPLTRGGRCERSAKNICNNGQGEH